MCVCVHMFICIERRYSNAYRQQTMRAIARAKDMVYGKGLSCVSSPLHFRLLTCCGTSARQCSFPLSAHLSGKSVTVFNHPHTNNRPAFEPLLLLLSRFSITALPHCSSAVLCVWAYRIVCCARKLPKTLKASQRIQLFSNCGMQMCYYMPKLLIRHVWRFGLMHCKSR